MTIFEKPGASTPWPSINQLLAPDERFAVESLSRSHYLFAPKHPSQLTALFYLLNQQKIKFEVQEVFSHSDLQAMVSARAFSQLHFYEEGVVEAGAGISLYELHQFLSDVKQETSFEEAPLEISKQPVGQLLLSGRTSGLRLRQDSFREALLGVELVTFDGSLLKWGGKLKGGSPGAQLHRLLPGLKSFPGMIVKLYLKTYPVPPSRLRLAWSFDTKKELMHQYQALKNFSSSWEYVEFIVSGKERDKGFIFAQISGLSEEMEAFSRSCPGYSNALQKGERNQMKKFLQQQQQLKAYPVSPDQSLDPGEYLWVQEGGSKAWRLTCQDVEEEGDSSPEWEKRFLQSMTSDG